MPVATLVLPELVLPADPAGVACLEAITTGEGDLPELPGPRFTFGERALALLRGGGDATAAEAAKEEDAVEVGMGDRKLGVVDTMGECCGALGDKFAIAAAGADVAAVTASDGDAVLVPALLLLAEEEEVADPTDTAAPAP